MSDIDSAVDTATEGAAAPEAAKTEQPAKAPAAKAEAASKVAEKPAGAAKPVVAAVDPGTKEEPKAVTEWPENWRDLLAGKDEAAKQTLNRFDSPAGLWRKIVNLDKTVKATRPQIKPDADATPEEWAEYRKTVGIPEKPEGYYADGKLADGRLIGEADKPIVESFAKAAHEAGLPKAAVDTALNWYYGHQEQVVSELRAQDEEARANAHVELRKDENWGPDFKRNLAAIGALFSGDARTTDYSQMGEEAQSLFDAVMGARTADGSLLGNNIAFVKFMSKLGNELYPAATYIPNAGSTGQGIEAELAEIEKIRRTDRRRYDKDAKLQQRERDLLDLQQRTKSRAA